MRTRTFSWLERSIGTAGDASANGRHDAGAGALAIAAVTALLLVAAPTADAVAQQKQGKNTSRSSTGSGPKVYRWVDDEGVVHFGDQVPPEFADHDRQVLNRYGVAVGTEQHQKSEEQLAAEHKADAERAAAAAAARRDGVLLSTYLTVEEIQALRDRRVDLIAGQIRITESYLDSLREKLTELQAEASNYKPYSTDPEAPAIDGNLAGEISDVLDSITLYERTLADTRARQGRLTAQFDADIARFRELTAP